MVKPVFIISQPRSGSTLLQTILAQHPSIQSYAEPWILLPFLSFFNTGINRYDFNGGLARTALSEFLNNSNTNEYFVREFSDFFRKIYNKASEGNKEYFVDKNPRYYEILEELIKFFPDSKIIVIKRNPFAVLHSIIEKEGVTKKFELIKSHRDILYAPKIINDFCNRQQQNENIRIVKYEDVISYPSQNLSSLFGWLNLSYDDEFMDFKENHLKGSLGDEKIRKTNQLNADGLLKWKDRLSDKSWRSFFLGYSDYLGPDFFQDNGYDPVDAQKKTLIFSAFRYVCEAGKKSASQYSAFRYRFFRMLLYK